MWHETEFNPTSSNCVHLLIHGKEFELDPKLMKHCEKFVRLMKQQELTEFVKLFDVSGVMLKNEEFLNILSPEFIQHFKRDRRTEKKNVKSN